MDHPISWKILAIRIWRFMVKPRTFNSFDEMSKENAISRVFLGVRWRFDCEEGLRLGDLIGEKSLRGQSNRWINNFYLFVKIRLLDHDFRIMTKFHWIWNWISENKCPKEQSQINFTYFSSNLPTSTIFPWTSLNSHETGKSLVPDNLIWIKPGVGLGKIWSWSSSMVDVASGKL